jgi:hypothetical protein
MKNRIQPKLFIALGKSESVKDSVTYDTGQKRIGNFLCFCLDRSLIS